MTELKWWATAPAWARWHTWDGAGKAWWEERPIYNNDCRRWQVVPDAATIPKYQCYDNAFLPVELKIDPALTLRKRPKKEESEC